MLKCGDKWFSILQIVRGIKVRKVSHFIWRHDTQYNDTRHNDTAKLHLGLP